MNPNWQEVDRLAINYTKCSQGVTRKLKKNLVRDKANPRITRLQDKGLKHSVTPASQGVLFLDFSKNYSKNYFLVTFWKLVKDDFIFCWMSTLLHQYKPLALSNTLDLHAH